MSIIIKEPERKYTPAPEGLHQAVCCDVVDLGIVATPWGDKHQVELRWEIEAINPDTGGPHLVRQRYTASLGEKAKLRQALEPWRGRKFTPQELAGFDLEKLIGVNCQLQVVHNLSDDGRTWANVQAVIAHNHKLPKIVVSADYVRQKDRPKDQQIGNGNGHAQAASPAKPKEEEFDDIPF